MSEEEFSAKSGGHRGHQANMTEGQTIVTYPVKELEVCKTLGTWLYHRDKSKSEL